MNEDLSLVRDQAGILYYPLESIDSGTGFFSGGYDIADMLEARISQIGRLRFVSASKFIVYPEQDFRALNLINMTIACPKLKATGLTKEDWAVSRILIFGAKKAPILNITAQEALGIGPAPGYSDSTDSKSSHLYIWIGLVAAMIIGISIAAYAYWNHNWKTEQSTEPSPETDHTLSQGILGNESTVMQD